MAMRNACSHCGFLVAAISGLVLVSGCAGTVSRRAVDTEVIKTPEATEVDLRSIAQKMARSLIELPQIAKAETPPKIAFLSMRNRTLQDLDSYNLLSSIRKLLMQYGQGRFVFLNREVVDKLRQERRLKREGKVASSALKDLYGVDFFLSGVAYSQVRDSGKLREAYYRYSFQLTEAETSAIVWEDDYEFKKVGERGTSHR